MCKRRSLAYYNFYPIRTHCCCCPSRPSLPQTCTRYIIITLSPILTPNAYAIYYYFPHAHPYPKRARNLLLFLKPSTQSTDACSKTTWAPPYPAAGVLAIVLRRLRGSFRARWSPGAAAGGRPAGARGHRDDTQTLTCL